MTVKSCVICEAPFNVVANTKTCSRRCSKALHVVNTQRWTDANREYFRTRERNRLRKKRRSPAYLERERVKNRKRMRAVRAKSGYRKGRNAKWRARYASDRAFRAHHLFVRKRARRQRFRERQALTKTLHPFGLGAAL